MEKNHILLCGKQLQMEYVPIVHAHLQVMRFKCSCSYCWPSTPESSMERKNENQLGSAFEHLQEDPWLTFDG